MVERRRRTGRCLGTLRGARLAALIAWFAVASIVLAGPAGTLAAEEVEGGPLDGPFADAALIPASSPGAGEGIPPRLLVLHSPAIDANGIIRVGLLERGRSGWEVVGEQALPSGLPGPVEGGFLLPLGDDRFAVAASSGRSVDSSSVLLGITIYRRQLSTWARTGLPMSMDAAGVADTDGNGSSEVVALDRGDGLCGGALVSVLAGNDLGEVGRIQVEGYRTAAGTFGRFDGRPGADLALGTRRSCGDGTATVGGVIVVSLRDGSTTDVGTAEAPPISAQRPLPARPLAADLDGDGRDDLLTAGRDGIFAHAAADGWRPRAIGQGLPLATLPVAGGRGTWVAVLDGSDQQRVVRLRGLSVAGGDTVAIGGPEPGETLRSAATFTVDAITRSTAIRFATGTWVGDVDGDGCSDLLVPRLTLLCADGGSVRVGPGWYATSPVGAYGETGARRLVVAGTAAWPGGSAVLSAPTPAGDAAAAPRWRSGVSPSFLLSEVSVGDLLYHREFPVPGVAMGRTQPSGDELAVSLGGFIGERMFVRSIPLSPGADVGSHESLADFLAGAAGSRGLRSVGRIPVAPGADSGAANGFIRLPLDLDAAAHQVTAVGINDWGEVSPIERVRVEADRIGPTLVVAAPLTSLPWPLVARLDGVADPGSRVRLGDTEVEVPRNGRFSVRTSLAPWPQTLEFTAIDGAGNETVRRVSVVGGVDYRQFPWEVILGALVLAAALLASLRAPRRPIGSSAAGPRLATSGPILVLGGLAVPPIGPGRSPRSHDPAPSQAVDADGLPIAVIEDLD